jgi:hypothetical protein
MANALANHSVDTLRRYARKVYDHAARAYRKQPTEAAGAVLKSAMMALRIASELFAGAPHVEYIAAADAINASARALSALLVKLGEAEFSL